MTTLDGLIARSKQPGRFQQRRKFTLSRDKAIEKQREFALRDPRQYITELVQAAVFSGATYIAIDLQPGSVLVAWVGGRQLKQTELVHLLDYLFADRTLTETRHLVQLAVGVNALMQRAPNTLRIESGDGRDSVRVDLNATGDGTVGVPEQSIAGTYVMAELSTNWLKQWFDPTAPPEIDWVERLCIYTPVPILLNGDAPFGYRSSRSIQIFGARATRQLKGEDGRRGAIALHHSTAESGYRIVIGGVWICSLKLEELTEHPLVGVICDDGLRKTADHSDIVQDHRYVRLLHAVQPDVIRLLRDHVDKRYRAPRLPPIPRAAPVESAPTASVETVEAEPLPNHLEQLGVRGLETLANLARLSEDRSSALFWCTPDTAEELSEAGDPSRFPYAVLVLTPGQALTLQDALTETLLSPLTSRADLDFVRRASERRSTTREHSFVFDRATITATLHLSGQLPDWGHARPGVPVCVTFNGETKLAGAVNGSDAVWSTPIPPWSGLTANVRPTEDTEADPVHRRHTLLELPLVLPGVSLSIDLREPMPLFKRAMLGAILAEIWRLVDDPSDEPTRHLLAALVGRLSVPQLLDGTGPAVTLNPPNGASPNLNRLPLATASDGAPITADALCALAGTDQVVEVDSEAVLERLHAIEQRIGFGHVVHPSVAGTPSFAVAFVRVAGRDDAQAATRVPSPSESGYWIALDLKADWNTGMEQLILVGGCNRPQLGDATWNIVARPHPCLVHAVRQGAKVADAEEGWALLHHTLMEMALSDRWPTTHPLGLDPERARSMGRLALFALADRVPSNQGWVLSTDGSVRRKPSDLASAPDARVVAHLGIHVSEPSTFALTAGERQALAATHPPVRLRYDDPPQVWQSLKSKSDEGWLVRQAVSEGGLGGWLGLRHPFDPTTGLLVQATGRMIGIPELDHLIPCHGLLWPDQEAVSPTARQLELLNLAGLRLYQGLHGLLKTETDPARRETAERYAISFVLRTWRPSTSARGTTADLARQVTVRHEDGTSFGTLEAWLETPADARPPLPEDLHLLVRATPPAEHATALTHTDAGPQIEGLKQRLDSVFKPYGWTIALTTRPTLERPVALLREASTHAVCFLAVGLQHSIGRGARIAGIEQELWLLEATRLICRYSRTAPTGATAVPLLDAQQSLIRDRLLQHP